jgi:hypothetical protein
MVINNCRPRLPVYSPKAGRQGSKIMPKLILGTIRFSELRSSHSPYFRSPVAGRGGAGASGGGGNGRAVALEKYFKAVASALRKGDATEPSFYPFLKDLFESYGTLIKRKIGGTINPKPTEGGNPDFRIWDEKRKSIVGYIEAKAPGIGNLDQIESTEQVQRYLSTFPNFILTNFFEFRLYRNGEKIAEAVLPGRTSLAAGRKTSFKEREKTDFFELLDTFLGFSIPETTSAEDMAVGLAKRTRYLKAQIAEELKKETEKGKGFILGFYKAFKEHLIAGLSQEDFANLYAQTVTYGLFAARTRAAGGFTRRAAFDNIPRSLGILRDVFRFISSGDLPQEMEWIVDDISEVLAVSNIRQLLLQYFQEGKGSDPIFHFYETFLAEYNPRERERRGVYYTPQPVVSYIVHSLHQILKSKFGKKDGFADSSVTVLDPAAGTLTFPVETARLAVSEFVEKYGEGARSGLIRDHILRNLYALELMMAPYAVGHIKMALLLEELGYKLRESDRFRFYLANTLDPEELAQGLLPGIASLAEESRLAGEVKRETPILVIMGNPPYSGHSANPSERLVPVRAKSGRKKWRREKTWIGALIEDYKKVDGRPLKEKNPKWLQDDYVKFIRFAQWKIDQAGQGVLGFITNHGYLDSPTFRGMRQSLERSFDEIYVLDLHGSVKKGETSLDGSKDENVFDIQQGVAIALFVKTGKGAGEARTRVFHAEQRGTRESKYAWLSANDVETTDWQEIHPQPPMHYFAPFAETAREKALLADYQEYAKVTDIFPLNCLGVQTHRDHFVIDFSREALLRRIELFRDASLSDKDIRRRFDLKDNRDWKMAVKRERIIADANWEESVRRFFYRPFDSRWIFFHSEAIDFGRLKVMRHMLAGDNLCLLAPRQISTTSWLHALATDEIAESCAVSNKTREQNYNFPLYRYFEAERGELFQGRQPNLNPALVRALVAAYAEEPSPEALFHYIYGILYSNVYRERYAAFLTGDFPRVPFTGDYGLFTRVGEFGRDLVDLHLLRSPELDPPLARFQGSGEGQVEEPGYNERENRVYINQDQYFEGVAKEVWEYRIGGYQVLHKWLKDRKGRNLSLEDIKHCCRVATALRKTMETQAEIDQLYGGVEDSVLETNLGKD